MPCIASSRRYASRAPHGVDARHDIFTSLRELFDAQRRKGKTPIPLLAFWRFGVSHGSTQLASAKLCDAMRAADEPALRRAASRAAEVVNARWHQRLTSFAIPDGSCAELHAAWIVPLGSTSPCSRLGGDSERRSWPPSAWPRSSFSRARGYEPYIAGAGSKCRSRRIWQRVSRGQIRATPSRCSAGHRARRTRTDRHLEHGFRAAPVRKRGACAFRVV